VERGGNRVTRAVIITVVTALLGIAVWSGSATGATPPAPGDWTGYLGGPLHQSVANDTTITRTDVGALTTHWRFKLPAVASRDRTIYATPATWHGTIYVAGDTGVLYALKASNASIIWKHDFGVIPMLECSDAQGIVGSPAVRADASGHPFVYINAPDGYLYELDGLTGATVWHSVVQIPSRTVDNTLPWSSPTLAGGRVYVGISSNCDNPFVRGAVKSYDALTGRPIATAWTMPPGVTGAGVWTSVAASGNSVYATTGSTTTETQSKYPPTNTNANDQYSMLKFNAATLVRTGKWVAPATTTYDPDFASSPILFNATIGGKSTPMVGACRKDGYFYALRADTMHLVWSFHVMLGTSGGQQNCLGGGVFDGKRLFLAGGFTTIAGVDYYGSVREVNPATGAAVWERGLPGVVLGAGAFNRNGILAYATADYMPGGAGNGLFLLDPSTGKVLRTMHDVHSWPEFAQPIWAGGQLLQTDFDAVINWSP
jgi:outer membrane protein assembly factor BamB